MKKKLMTLLLLAAALMLALTPVLAENLAEDWVADSVEGTLWQDDRASLEVEIPAGGNGYLVRIMWGSSAWEHTEWLYTCSYNEETKILTASHLVCDEVAYDEDGTETRISKIDVDCETTFSLNEEGKVVITNAADETLEGKTFTRVPDTYDSGEAVG